MSGTKSACARLAAAALVLMVGLAAYAEVLTSGEQSQLAQAEPAATPSDVAPPAPSPSSDEITVYTRKREEALQDVPVSVSALTEATIQQVAPTTLRDLDGLAPNLFVGKTTGGPGMGAIYIRGQGYADIEKAQKPPVGVLLDNVFLGTNTGQMIDSFDIEQVEINRGPQSVLFGKNTTGGTISVRRRRPDLGRFGGRAQATWGDYSGPGEGMDWNLQGSLNVPILQDVLAVRGGWISKGGSGYWTNQVSGQDEGDPDYKAANVKLLFEPTESLSILLGWDFVRDRSDQTPQDPRFDGYDPFVTRADREDEIALLDLQILFGEIRYELPNDLGSLTSVSAYLESKDYVQQDFDGAQFTDPNYPFAMIHTTRDQEYTQFSQELRYTNSFFDDRVSLTLGGFYWHHDLDFQQDTLQVLQLAGEQLGAPAPLPPGACTLAGLPNGAVDPLLGQMCLLPSDPSTQASGEEHDHWSVFVSTTIAITGSVNLTLGGRYLEEKTDFETEFHNTLVTGPPKDRVLVVPLSERAAWDALVGEAQLDWHPVENAMLYGAWSEGFRSGGFSIRGVDTCCLSFEPDSVHSGEVGAKTSWLAGRLIANVAGYYAVTEGAQFSAILTTPGVAPGTDTRILNHDELETYGAELETSFQLSDGLRLYAIFGWQEGAVTDSVQESKNLGLGPDGVPGTADDGTAGPRGGSFDLGEALSGIPLARTPQLRWTAGFTFTQPFGPGEFVVDNRIRWIDDFLIIPAAISGTAQAEESYTLVDASVAYRWELGENTTWRIAFVGRNLTDQEYRENALPLVGQGGFQGWGPPRLLGVQVGVDF